MPLTGPHLELVHKTILTAYDHDTFRRAMQAGMDVDFDAIAPEKGFDTQLWTYRTWANRRDRVKDVERCAWERNQENAALAKLWQKMAAENEDRGAIAPASNTVAKSGSAAPTKPAAMPTRTIPATTTPDTDPTPDSQPPKVFISYLWDGEAQYRQRSNDLEKRPETNNWRSPSSL